MNYRAADIRGLLIGAENVIPMTLLSCILHTVSGDIEVSAEDMSAAGFTFRVPKEDSGAAADAARATVGIYTGVQNGIFNIELDDISVTAETSLRFCDVLRLETCNRGYAEAARELMRQYTALIKDRASGDANAAAVRMLGYPGEADTEYPDDFPDYRRELIGGSRPDRGMRAVLSEANVYIAADTPEKCLAYAETGIYAYMSDVFEDTGLCGHPVAHVEPAGVYIGNAWCMGLMPDRELLDAVAERASADGKDIVFVLPPVKQHELSYIGSFIKTAVSAGVRSFEVNDWGTLVTLHESGIPDIRLGILLNKRRKDSRAGYLPGAFASGNALNAAFWAEKLIRYGVTGAAVESCGYDTDLPACLKTTLHGPFYQMNTASVCTLNAAVNNGSRGSNHTDDGCGRCCHGHVFIYPKALKAIGRYNTLFGYDPRMLEDSGYIRDMLNGGTDRIVLELL